jgi:hypothetical protein
MVFDNRGGIAIPLELGVWLVCTIIAIGSYLGKFDIGLPLGIITWGVFIFGIIFLISRL